MINFKFPTQTFQLCENVALSVSVMTNLCCLQVTHDLRKDTEYLVSVATVILPYKSIPLWQRATGFHKALETFQDVLATNQ